MAIALKDIILTYIDDALDIDDLENIGDFVRMVIEVENLGEWQLNDALRQLHADLLLSSQTESNRATRLRLKAALLHFEADFCDYLINRETESLPQRKN